MIMAASSKSFIMMEPILLLAVRIIDAMVRGCLVRHRKLPVVLDQKPPIPGPEAYIAARQDGFLGTTVYSRTG
jgi:hypothetical protein